MGDRERWSYMIWSVGGWMSLRILVSECVNLSMYCYKLMYWSEYVFVIAV